MDTSHRRTPPLSGHFVTVPATYKHCIFNLPEEELRDKEDQWAYKLSTLRPYELNDNDFFLYSEQALKTHVIYRVLM